MVAVPSISVSVGLVFTNYTNPRAIPALKVSVPQGTNAFQVLQMASKENPCYNFQFTALSKLGRFITSICCLEQDPSTGFYWRVYRNGALAKHAVDSLTPKDGDTLTFKYEYVNSGN